MPGRVGEFAICNLQHGYPFTSGLTELGGNWRVDDGVVGHGWNGYDLLEESCSDSADASGLAPVEAKRELIKVRPEVFAADAAVIGAEQPAFEEVGDAVALLERIFDLEVELLEFQPIVGAGSEGLFGVALEAVGGDGGRWRDVSADETDHIGLSEASRVLEPRSSTLLCGDEDQGFARTPSVNSCGGTNIGFIDDDVIIQGNPILTSGAAPQFVHPGPCGLVGAEAEDPLQLLGADAILTDTHLPDSSKPHPQRLPRLVQDSACGDAGLVATSTALEPSVGELPDIFTITLPATGPATPPDIDQVASASLIVGKHGLELRCCLRKRAPHVFDVHQVPPEGIYGLIIPSPYARGYP